MSKLEIRLFGEALSVVDASGKPFLFASRRAEALLIALALKSGGCDVRGLAQLLLGDAAAGEQVRRLVEDLQRVLPAGTLLERDGQLMLNDAEVEVDASAFDRMVGAASINSVRKAAEIYRANLLEGFSLEVPEFDRWISERRLLYWRAALVILGNLLTAQVRAGWWEEAIETAGRLLALDPSQEVVHRTLIRLQLEQGRPDSALRRYEECADLLRRDFGREPTTETRRLREEIMHVLEKNPAPRGAVLPAADGPTLVLVVEDDLVSSALVEAFLEEAGFEVVVVRDGGEALIELGRRRFDLIVLDINVPILSGLQVFEIMLQKQLDTPALFITGVSGTEVEMQSLEMGAAGFLRKPIRKEVLLPKIRGILQRNQRERMTTG